MVRDYTYGGEGRLIQLRQLVDSAFQLKQKNVESQYHFIPYTENCPHCVTGVAWHHDG
jgi:hypothetical protein